MPSHTFYVIGVFGAATEVHGIPVRHFVYDRANGKSLLIPRTAVSPTYCPWVKLKLKVRGDTSVPAHIHTIRRVVRAWISPRIQLDEVLQYYLRNLSEESANQTFDQWRACYPMTTTTVACVEDLKLTIASGMALDQAQRVRALHEGMLCAMATMWLDVSAKTRRADEHLLCYFGESVLGVLQPKQRRQMCRFFFAPPMDNFWRLFCWPFFVAAMRPILAGGANHLIHTNAMAFCRGARPRCHQYTSVNPCATLDQAPTEWRRSPAGVRTQRLIVLIDQQYRAQVQQACDIYPLNDPLFSEPPYRALDDSWCCLDSDYVHVAACSTWLQENAQNIWLYDTRRHGMFPEHTQYLLQDVIPEDTTHTLLITTSSTRSAKLSTHTALPWYALSGGVLPDSAAVVEEVTSVVLDNAHKTTLREVVQWIRQHWRVAVAGFRLYVCGDSLAFGCTYLRGQGNFFRDLLCVRSPALPFAVSRPLHGCHATVSHEVRLLQTLRSKATRNLHALTMDAFDEPDNAKRVLATFAAQVHHLKSGAREINYQIAFVNEGHCNIFLDWCQQHGFPRQPDQETVSNGWIRCHSMVSVRSTGDSGKVDSVRSVMQHGKKHADTVVKKRGVDCRESVVEIDFNRGKRRKMDTTQASPLTLDCSKGEKIRPVSVQTLSLDDGSVHDYTFLQLPVDFRALVTALGLTQKCLLFFGEQPREELEKLCKLIEKRDYLKGMKAFYRKSSKAVQLSHVDIFAQLREEQLEEHSAQVSLFARFFASSFHCTRRN